MGNEGRRRAARWVLAVLLALLALPLRAGQGPVVEAATNPIVTENQQPGTSAWVLGQGQTKIADDTNQQIKGYAAAPSVNKGQSITFYVTVTPAQSYTIDVYRMGWYQGLGGRLMQHIGPLNGVQQATCPIDATTGMIACNWSPSYTLAVPTTWTSGIYLAVLTNAQNYQNDIIFTVRDDARVADLLFEQAVTTYQAYNDYPDDGQTGKSLYEYNSYGPTTVAGTVRAVKVSFDRPYADRGQGLFDSWEIYMVQWMESQGYDVTYATDLDTNNTPQMLLNYKGFIMAGHDEYYSQAMYNAVQNARDDGVNLGFFAANSLYWQVRFEASASGVPNRVMVCYKGNGTTDPLYPGPTTTVKWRDPQPNRPEQGVLGIQFLNNVLNGGPVPYVVQNASNWVYANTGLHTGDAVPGIVGHEADSEQATAPLPASINTSYTLLSASPFTDINNTAQTANSVIYQAPSQAWVFNAGTIDWSWGLENYGGTTYADPRIQQTTANIFNQFITTAAAPPAAPSTLTANARSTNRIDLAWTDTATTEGRFILERATNSSFTSNLTSLTLGANTTSYSDTTLNANTTYFYRIRAYNTAGYSAYSNTASATTLVKNAVYATDSFTRTVSGAWGTPDFTDTAGLSWQLTFGSASAFAVGPDFAGSTGAGKQIATAAGQTRQMTLALNHQNVSATVRVALDQVPVGNNLNAYIYLRYVNDFNWYRLGVVVTPSKTITLNLEKEFGSSSSFTQSTLASQTISGLTYAAKTYYRLRFETESTSATATTLRGKIWPDGTTEPASFQVSASGDTTASLQTAGSLALRSYTASSYTGTLPVTYYWDDLSATTLFSP
jgi:hypothetical protein